MQKQEWDSMPEAWLCVVTSSPYIHVFKKKYFVHCLEDIIYFHCLFFNSYCNLVGIKKIN